MKTCKLITKKVKNTKKIVIKIKRNSLFKKTCTKH